MYNPFTLKGKCILVTGASSGIGQQIAISVAKMGAQVVITGRNKERLLATYEQLEGEVHQSVLADLTEEKALANLVDVVPTLNGIVYSAGVTQPFPIKFLKARHIDPIQSINYQSVVLLTAALLRKKKVNSNAAFVFLSSIASQHPHRGAATYAGTKAAIEAFAKVLALEHASQGIRANCISPGLVKTPMYANTEKAMGKDLLDGYAEKYPLGLGTPEDIAHAAIFLLSDASKWMSGSVLRLDGGLLAGIH